MNAYILIGEPNMRKSTLIRSLTGCFNQNDRDIRLVSGSDIKVYVRVSSLQEAKISPSDFIKDIKNRNCSNILISLWQSPNQTNPKKFPDAHTYISMFSQSNWNIIKTATLGNLIGNIQYPNSIIYPSSNIDPVNVTSKDIRRHFGWL